MLERVVPVFGLGLGIEGPGMIVLSVVLVVLVLVLVLVFEERIVLEIEVLALIQRDCCYRPSGVGQAAVTYP